MGEKFILTIVVIFIVAIGTIFYFSYQQQTQQKTTEQNTIPDILEKQVYSNAQYVFQINAPKGWSVDESGRFGAIVIFFNTKTDKEGVNSFVANINVALKSTEGLDLNDYVNTTKDSLQKSLQDYKSIEDKILNVNGRQARLIGMTSTDEDGFHFRQLQLIVVKSGKAYFVTATVLNSTWNQYKDLVESSLLTFNLN